MSTLSLRLPESQHKAARKIAENENISINQLITFALAEKLSALGAAEYLAIKASRASEAKFLEAMVQVAKVEPPEYDRL